MWGIVILKIAAGITSGNEDALIIKTNSSGIEEWREIIDNGARDVAYSIQQIFDGYIIIGYTNSFGNGGYDVWLVKLAP